ncbi:MAG: hypothetical protein H7Z37_01335, partial [Pyrinomonadaceae bacterium]|nr:hypothetical protein [Pyrinomonadaceae bacterium]
MKTAILLLAIFLFCAVAPSNAQTSSDGKTDEPNAAKIVTTATPEIVAEKSKAEIIAEKSKPIIVPLVVNAPVIDGNINEEFWKQATIFKDFIQTNPGDNAPASKATECFLAYDELNLYFACHCFDEPDKVRATVAKRDNVFGEDNVRLFLDTYDDQRRAFVLGFNPLGIQQDGIYTEGQGTDFNVDIVMESKGAMDETGWAVEAKIPFKSLRYASGKGKFWGVQVQRNIDRFGDELDSWKPIDRNNPSLLIQAGKLGGLDNIKFEKTLELVPSTTLSQTGERIQDNSFISNQRFLQRGLKPDIGLTVKYTITPNITLDAAINPDFAEVEADAPIVSANQRFPTFFPEKRPFFLEGVDIFLTPIPIVYTRTIQNPDIAAKLTGKIGKTSFGFLAADDNIIGSDDNAKIGVLRVKTDIGKENSLGFIATARMFPDSRNFLGGVDGKYKPDSSTTFTFQAAASRSNRFFYNPNLNARENRAGNGFAYDLNLDYTKKNYGYTIQANGRTGDYRADVGFTRRTNTNQIFYATRISSEPQPKNTLIRKSWNTFGDFNYNFQGGSQDGFLGTAINLNFQRNTFFNIEGGGNYSRLREDEFGARRTASKPNQGAFFGSPERSTFGGYVSSYIFSAPSKRISFELNPSFSWNSFDFDFGSGQRFPRRSSAYENYLRDSSTNPDLNEPALDPGPGKEFR